MKVLFASSEAAPLIKSGGLGDVAGALPKALHQAGTDVRVILPYYMDIPAKWKEKTNFIRGVWVPLAWRTQYCGVYELTEGGITYYLLENKYYFERSGLYGYYDDAERFAFFCKAALEILQYIDFMPDLIHCNDWQTAMIPVYLKAFYQDVQEYKNIRTLYTIHNIQYQGVFGPEVTDYVLGLDRACYDGGWLQFDGAVNLMKAAIVSADWVSTVSPTYAEEIKTETYSHGLHWILRQEAAKISGIINGIDTEVYDPAADPHLFSAYSADALDGKAVNKRRLQEVLGLPVRAEVPMIAMVTRLVDHKGMDLVKEALDTMLSSDIQLVVLGTGEYEYEEMFREAAARFPLKVSANLTFNTDLAQKIYAGADLFLMPSISEPCGLSQMIAMRYGTVPIVRETGGLKDTVAPYDRENGSGTGFVFKDADKEGILWAFDEALRAYHSDSFSQLIHSAMTEDFSWTQPAQSYLKIYKMLTGLL